MSLPIFAGTLPRLLCLPLFLAAFTASDGRNPQDKSAQRLMDEFQANADATMRSAAAQPGSKLAGPPVHVDPYVHSAGMNRPGLAHGKSKGC